MTPRAVVAIPAALTLSCSALLGGLEEGTARRSDTPDAGAPAAPPPPLDASTCIAPWLEGYAYRTPFTVENDGPPVGGYSVALGLDTKRLVDEGRMRADGADIRLVAPDGSVAPHWVASGINGEATHLWTKVDVPSGTSHLLLYHGKPDAEPSASLASTFVEGIVANGHFDLGSAPWVSFTPSDGTYKLEIGSGIARISVQRDPSTSATALGFCQRVVFPEGGHRLVFDHDGRDAGRAYLTFWVGGIGGKPIWRGEDTYGPRADEETDVVPGGETELCFGIDLPASAPYRQGLTAEVWNVRVRVAPPLEPFAGQPGPTEPRCTR